VRRKEISMVPVIAAAARKAAAREAILKRLRENGATNAAMPRSLDTETEDAKAALTALLQAGTLREPRPNLFFIDEQAAKKTAEPGSGFVALVAILVALSFAASLIALASTLG
jgi:hypothetical protein